jgi:Xaa-Pro aminopeptidase
VTDFPEEEYHQRLERIQPLMHKHGIDALLLTSEAEIRYFSGFRTAFWLSPARPWFLIIPQKGEPIAVIPDIGVPLMRRTWVKDIRHWSSPFPKDEGMTLLGQTLASYSTVGVMMGAETRLFMALSDFDALRQKSRADFRDCTGIIRAVMMVKSPAEIALIGKICAIAGRCFAKAGALFHEGQSMQQIFRLFKISLLEEGADDVPYLVGGKGRYGYEDVVSPPGAEKISTGDVLMLDTGATLNGYFCDFDRNFTCGRADDAVLMAHEKLWHATEAGLEAARPGAYACDVAGAMMRVLEGDSGGNLGNVGRLGHGLGMQLTEQPSFAVWDKTVLRPGMVLTLEPSISTKGGCILVTEENIVITEDAPILLTPRAEKTPLLLS